MTIPSPILGGFDVSRSKNAADNQMINLFLELIETKDGYAPAYLQMCPGLTLMGSAGDGPIRGPRGSVMGGYLYIVSGSQAYQVSPSFAVVALGTLQTSTGTVSIINNGTQVAFFDGIGGYFTTASAALNGGAPLFSGAVGTGGTLYAVGDTITLIAANGVQDGTAIITVTTVSAGAVTGFTVAQGGLFSVQPASFRQASTSGSGANFVLINPTYGSVVKLATLSLPFSNPLSATYQDGFGLVSVAGTQLWYQSDLNDLSNWQALNFSSADATPDNILALADLMRQVFIIKETHTEVWVNAGQAGFSFVRLQGPFLEIGTPATASVAKAGPALLWLSQTTQGTRQVVMVTGYNPRIVSTHALDAELATYSTVSDAVAYAYQQEGHTFYVITFPTADITWSLDVTETLRVNYPVWHRRASFSNGAFHRHWGNCYATLVNAVSPLANIVGDYQNGNLYAFDLDNTTDNGTQRKWLRSWRALIKPSTKPQRFPCLTINMETGLQVPDGTDPQATLRWTDDGGHNWSDEMIRSVGKTGQTAKRVFFRPLGSTRRLTGLDRTFELSSSDRFKVAILGAEIEA